MGVGEDSREEAEEEEGDEEEEGEEGEEGLETEEGKRREALKRGKPVDGLWSRQRAIAILERDNSFMKVILPFF